MCTYDDWRESRLIFAGQGSQCSCPFGEQHRGAYRWAFEAPLQLYDWECRRRLSIASGGCEQLDKYVFDCILLNSSEVRERAGN